MGEGGAGRNHEITSGPLADHIIQVSCLGRESSVIFSMWQELGRVSGFKVVRLRIKKIRISGSGQVMGKFVDKDKGNIEGVLAMCISIYPLIAA